jgi:acylglycerol lipase
MRHKTGTMTTEDGLRLHTVRWLPAGDPDTLLLVAHGLGEHSGRYIHVAEQLTARGYAVFSFDHRGHGRSEGPRAYFDDFDLAVAELGQFAGQLRAEFPGHRLFVFGHSMGALVSLLYALRHQDQLAGWISSATTLTLDKAAPRLLVRAGQLLNRIMPRLPYRKIDSSTLSRDPQVVQSYEDDPLVYHRPLRLGVVNALIEYSQRARQRLDKLRLPLLILHGGADALTPATGSQLLYERAASPDKTLKIYDGLYHEILNDPEGKTVLEDIAAWLDARAPIN